MKSYSVIATMFCFALAAAVAAQPTNVKGLTENPFFQKFQQADNVGTVQIATLTSQWMEQIIVLRWKSVATDLSGYFVQYSKDGKFFETVAYVPAIASGQYVYEAASYEGGANFFRLIEIKSNGEAFAASNSISVVAGVGGTHVLNMERTSAGSIKVSLQVKKNQQIEWKVLDGFGNAVATLFKGDMTAHEIMMRDVKPQDLNLAAGTYFMFVQGDTFKESKGFDIN